MYIKLKTLRRYLICNILGVLLCLGTVIYMVMKPVVVTIKEPTSSSDSAVAIYDKSELPEWPGPPVLQEQLPEIDGIVYLGEYTITGYCSCARCCGEWASKQSGGVIVGAANQPLVAGISAAALQENLPLGTAVYIEGIGVRIVQDTGPNSVFARYDGRLIDVYCNTHAEAVALGKSEKRVWIIESPNTGI